MFHLPLAHDLSNLASREMTDGFSEARKPFRVITLLAHQTHTTIHLENPQTYPFINKNNAVELKYIQAGKPNQNASCLSWIDCGHAGQEDTDSDGYGNQSGCLKTGSIRRLWSVICQPIPISV